MSALEKPAPKPVAKYNGEGLVHLNQYNQEEWATRISRRLKKMDLWGHVVNETLQTEDASAESVQANCEAKSIIYKTLRGEDVSWHLFWGLYGSSSAHKLWEAIKTHYPDIAKVVDEDNDKAEPPSTVAPS